MIRAMLAAAFVMAVLMAAVPAQADLRLCNRTSYRIDAAIGLEKRAAVSTRGWFRVDPGECKPVIAGDLDADMVYVHARTPPVYGDAPLARAGNAKFCVGHKDFNFADARGCAQSRQARFTAAQASDSGDGPTINLAEELGYDDAQARLAGVQRLLTIAGYDAYPIDGVQGAKTQSALARFLKERKLPADAATKPEFFGTLFEAARNPQGTGFAWCNDTSYTVMAAVGTVEMGAIVTRGWYRVAPSRCVRPTLRGEPHRLYSYAEAVDAGGRAVKRGEAPLAWGGNVALCTRDGKFELADHKDCLGRGLNSAGFAVMDIGADPAKTVHFKEP